LTIEQKKRQQINFTAVFVIKYHLYNPILINQPVIGLYGHFPGFYRAIVAAIGTSAMIAA